MRDRCIRKWEVDPDQRDLDVYKRQLKTPIKDIPNEAIDEILYGTGERLRIKNEALGNYNYMLSLIHIFVAVPLARFAAPPLHVKRESARLVTAYLCLRHPCEEVAYIGEYAGIGGRVGAGAAADGRLVDAHHLIEMCIRDRR